MLEFMYRRLSNKNKLKKLNNKGISSIELVIGVLIFILMFSFLVDITLIIWKFSVIAQTNNEVARITGLQGGALYSVPSGYPGSSSNYYTIDKLNTLVGEKLKAAGIKQNEWKMSIGSGRIGKNGVSEVKEDYGQMFNTHLEVDYKWDFMKNFLPGELKGTVKSKRVAVSEWKYNYDSWYGE